MPVRWSPENDQLLLLKILETHDLSVDTKKVAEAWPGTDSNSRPTPRAITERLAKMRQIVKASNNGTEGHFGIGRGTNANPGSAASTPHKQRKDATAGPKTPTTGKRKHVVKAEEDVGGDADLLVKEEDDGKKPLGDASAGVSQGQGFVLLKTESIDEDVFMGDGSPSKRARRASTLPPGMVSTYNGEDSGTELDSSVSEYLPEESAKVEEEFWVA